MPLKTQNSLQDIKQENDKTHLEPPKGVNSDIFGNNEPQTIGSPKKYKYFSSLFQDIQNSIPKLGDTTVTDLSKNDYSYKNTPKTPTDPTIPFAEFSQILLELLIAGESYQFPDNYFGEAISFFFTLISKSFGTEDDKNKFLEVLHLTMKSKVQDIKDILETNDSKDIRSYKHIEKFLKLLAKAFPSPTARNIVFDILRDSIGFLFKSPIDINLDNYSKGDLVKNWMNNENFQLTPETANYFYFFLLPTINSGEDVSPVFKKKLIEYFGKDETSIFSNLKKLTDFIRALLERKPNLTPNALEKVVQFPLNHDPLKTNKFTQPLDKNGHSDLRNNGIKNTSDYAGDGPSDIFKLFVEAIFEKEPDLFGAKQDKEMFLTYFGDNSKKKDILI